MKKNLLTTVLTAALLAGCVTTPAPAPAIAFNYKTVNAGAIGIVQVFEMGGNTVVQIKGLEGKAPLFLSDGNAEIKYQVFGETAVLSGIQTAFNVVNAGAWAHVTRLGESPQAAASAPPQAASHVAVVKQLPPVPTLAATAAGPSNNDLRDQINELKRQIAALKKTMKTAEVPEAEEETPPAPQKPAYAPVASVKEATAVRVTFKDNSAQFQPRESLARTLLELAREASEISVTGYTDGSTATPTSIELARGRAVAARKFLVANGIDKSKIAVSFQPAGGFVADNSTKEGRDKNRRVEIEII